MIYNSNNQAVKDIIASDSSNLEKAQLIQDFEYNRRLRSSSHIVNKSTLVPVADIVKELEKLGD